GHLAVVLAGGRQLHVVLVDELLLEPHRVLFLDVLRLLRRDGGFGGGVHAALHSLIESAKVPACSRIGAIWPVFSAYLNAVYGTFCLASTSCSIGRSSSAGSQNDGAAKITPSAEPFFTCLSRYWPLSSRFASYFAAVEAERCRNAFDSSSSGLPSAGTSSSSQRVTSMKSSSTM